MTLEEKELIINLGNRLKHLRLKKGFSQESFADFTHLDRTYISGLERGQRNPSYLTLTKIAQALEISLCKLLDF